jgi:HK97 family phage portal protein
MAVIQTDSGIVAINRAATASLRFRGVPLYDNVVATYEFIYRTQPELRSAIDFLARNMAQLPLHAFERVSDVERRRLSSGPLASTLERPDVTITRSRWMDALVKDLAIYDAAYFVKVRGEAGRVALVRLPPQQVEIIGTNWLRPEAYRLHGAASYAEFPAEAVIDIHGYNPSDPRIGLSPIETLRRLLAEQEAAGEYRQNFWANAARMGGIIERPQTAPNWSDSARARFRAEFEASYTGAAASGRTLVLEEGMQYKPTAFSARDSQYLESFQLSREVVATAYGIPTGLLGLGSSTFSSLSEQHRQLYADCLAPWAVRIQEELELQLLPEFDTPEGTYIEVNLASKLAGSFQEQAAVLQASVGAPYLTRNEARTRLNLPPVDGGDALVTPLNVLIGGQANPQDSVSDERRLQSAAAPEPEAKAVVEIEAKQSQRFERLLRARSQAVADLSDDLAESFERQRRSVVSRVQARAKSSAKADVSEVFNVERFSRELEEDLRPALRRTARTMSSTVADWDVERGAEYIDAVASGFAASITATTAERLAQALDEEDPTEASSSLFENLATGMAALYAGSIVTSIGEWSRAEAADAAGLATKTWVVTSGNPRSSHSSLDGETVPRGDVFSNGAAWPGDPVLPAEERANCACLVDWGD